MDRRSFLRTAGAAAAAPLLPLPSMAAAPAATVNQFQVGFAALYARVNARASTALIQKWLQVGPGEAQVVMNELMARGIVHAPIAGSAAAIEPMYPNASAPGFFRKAGEAGKKAFDHFERLAADDPGRAEELGDKVLAEDSEDTEPDEQA